MIHDRGLHSRTSPTNGTGVVKDFFPTGRGFPFGWQARLGLNSTQFLVSCFVNFSQWIEQCFLCQFLSVTNQAQTRVVTGFAPDFLLKKIEVKMLKNVDIQDTQICGFGP